jgi:hypothetical protein
VYYPRFDPFLQSDPPNLEDFKLRLINTLLRQSFFQNDPVKPINMLKIPLIISPCLLSKQVNNDTKKKSLLDKTVVYDKNTFREFHRLVEKKEINILGIQDMNLGELNDVMTKLKVPVGAKNASMLRNELNNMSKHFIAGQVLTNQNLLDGFNSDGITFNQSSNLHKMLIVIHFCFPGSLPQLHPYPGPDRRLD